MATEAPVEEPRERECTICHEPFTAPKILPCGHLLCRHCLISWLQTEPDANCPLCRHPIVEGQLSSPASDVADRFPTHYFMAALVEADRLLSEQHVCCVCVNVAAVSLCVNCGDMFCQMCSKVHKKQSVSKHHQVETLASLTADTLAAKRPVTCPVHTGEVTLMFCSTHNVPVCKVCASTDHRQCPHMVKAETRAQESHDLLKEVTATLKTGEQKLERALEEIEEVLQNLVRQTDAGVAEIKAVQQRLEKAVQACCSRLMEKALRTSSEVQTKVLDEKAELKKQQVRLVTHSHIMDQMQGFSMHGDFSDMVEKMKKRADAFHHGAGGLASVKVTQELRVMIDLQAVKRIEQELAQLGVVSTEEREKPQQTSLWGIQAAHPGERVSPVLQFQVPTLRFHDHHGKSIRLTNGGLTAQRIGSGRGGGVVVSREPMVVNTLYEVSIDAINKEWNSTYLGVVTCNPETLDIPDITLRSLSGSYLRVCEDGGTAFGHLIGQQNWPCLSCVACGSRVGLALDSCRTLHLYFNGQDQGVITTNIPEPCYFMFNLYGYCTQVTALPVTAVHGT